MDPNTQQPFSWFVWKKPQYFAEKLLSDQNFIIRNSVIFGKFVLMTKDSSNQILSEDIFNEEKGYIYKGEYFISLAHLAHKYFNTPKIILPKVLQILLDEYPSLGNCHDRLPGYKKIFQFYSNRFEL